MRKNKGLLKKYLWLGLFIILVTSVIYFSFGVKEQTFSDTGAGNTFSSIAIKSSDQYSTTYTVDFSVNNRVGSPQACGSGISTEGTDYSFMILVDSYESFKFPSGHYDGTLKASNVVINGLRAQNHLSGCGEQYNIVNQTNTATCKYHDNVYGMDCTFRVIAQTTRNDGSIPVSPNEPIIYGIDSGSLDIIILKSGVQCTQTQTSLCTTNQECINNICTQKQIVAPSPTITQKPSFVNFLSAIGNWISDLFKNIFSGTSESIIGAKNVLPNSVQTYQISLNTTTPDSNYSDGSYQVQYSNWALVNTNNTIVQQGEWETITNGIYNKNITITVPNDLSQNVLIAMIYEYDMNYNFTTSNWTTSSESIKVKEGINLKTGLPIPVNPNPISLNIFSRIWDSIINFFKGLFGG